MPSIKTVTYERKPFEVQAVRVTIDNMTALADWCGGVVEYEKHGTKVVPFIKVPVIRPLGERQTKAFVGDWLLQLGSGFKTYLNKAFHANFDQKKVSDTAGEPLQDPLFDNMFVPAQDALDCSVEGKV